jgi:hypothetical protein
VSAVPKFLLPADGLMGMSGVPQQFKAQKGRPRGDLPTITRALGLDPQVVLNQPWTELSVRCFPVPISS